MSNCKLIPLFVVLAIGIEIAVQVSAAPSGQSTVPQPLVVFVVRHAEKESSGTDPELSAVGQHRAEALAGVLKDAKLDQIHSTNYKRTLLTAKPVADSFKLPTQTYDPRKLADFATALKSAGGRHLVVGHSNTTPALVRLLGGDPVSAIDDSTEYDRLYIVTVSETGNCTSVLLRYGETTTVESTKNP